MSLRPQLSDRKVKWTDGSEINSVFFQKIFRPSELRHLFFQRVKSTKEIKIILIRHVFLTQIIRRIQESGKITREDLQESFFTRIFLAQIMCSRISLWIQLHTVSISHNAIISFISSSVNEQIIFTIVSMEFLSRMFSANSTKFLIIRKSFWMKPQEWRKR